MDDLGTDDLETAPQRLAQVNRTLQLLNFRFMQLCHTNDQLLAGVKDLLARASLIDQARQVPHGDASPPPLLRKDPPS
jgi:hypothetical protein